MDIEAFVYCWTDRETGMVYFGSHKGSLDDGYICSSAPMLENYAARPETFSRDVIAVGSYADMRSLETHILQEFDAAHHPAFYNRHNVQQRPH
jgi:hypothetical protein